MNQLFSGIRHDASVVCEQLTNLKQLELGQMPALTISTIYVTAHGIIQVNEYSIDE